MTLDEQIELQQRVRDIQRIFAQPEFQIAGTLARDVI